MSYTKLLHYIKNNLISDSEALDRLENMHRDYVINGNQYIAAKNLLNF